MSLSSAFRAIILAFPVLVLTAPCFASGLIWHLPEDGSWIRYEGTYKQQTIRPEATDGNLENEWIRQLTIKSVGQENADFNGRNVPCRWIEIKAVTGKRSEAGIDAGPSGSRIYKVLVPESKVLGTQADRDGIPVTMLPIVKGYRRFGEGQVSPMKAKAIQVSPSVTLLSHYKTLETAAENVATNVPGGDFDAKRITAESKMERTNSRSVNKAEMWVSKEVPFGLVKWKVTIDREVKDLTDARTEFRETTKAVVEMSAHEIGDRAESELTEK